MGLLKQLLSKIIFSPGFFLSFFLCLIPISLISGPFLPDLFAILSVFIFLIFFLRNNLYIFSNNIFIILLATWLYFFCRSIFFGDIGITFKTFFYIRFILLAACIVYCNNIFKNFYKYFSFSLLLAICIVLISGYIEFFFQYNPLRSTAYTNNRLSGVFGDEMIIGSYLSIMAPLFVILCTKLNNRYSNFINFIILLASGSLILLSGERASLIIFFLFLFFYFLILLINSGTKKNIFYLIIIILINLLILKNIQSVSNRTGSIFSVDHLTLEKSNHLGHYVSAYKMFSDNIFFGQGPRSFRVLCSKDKFFVKNGCSTHPHNFYIQLLAETGFIGFFLFSIFYFYVLFIFCRLFFSHKCKNKNNFGKKEENNLEKKNIIKKNINNFF
jgi:O-antigen ligase